MSIKILILDDHDGVRNAIAIALKQNDSRFEYLQASDCESALKILLDNPECKTLILDLNLGHENGLDALDRIRQIRPGIRTLVWSMYWEPIRVLQANDKQVEGYVTKNSDLSVLKEAIVKISYGEKYFCEDVKGFLDVGFYYHEENDESRILTQFLFNAYKTLTKREEKIFALLAEGKSTVEISEILGRALQTIENQRNSIYKKLEVTNRAELISAAQKLGVI